MEPFGSEIPLALALICGSVAFGAGLVKGVVGFALPMIMISLLGSFLSPELALAGLILPTLVTNGLQALRQGLRAAWSTILQFRILLSTAAVMLAISAQLFVLMPVQLLFLAIGAPVTLFCLMQLFGLRFSLGRQIPWIEAAIGGFAGFIGGLSGVWGPPIVAYLTALNTEKRAQMRTQGVAFGLGSVLLLGAHWGSGVVTGATFAFSAALTLPAVLGMWLGSKVQDRIDQATFRKATLVILLVAGLNLLRRALFAA